MKVVRQIYLSADGIDLDYMDDTDVRAQGEVFQTHHLSIARGGHLNRLITEVEQAVETLVEEAITYWSTSQIHRPVDITDDLDDDDDDGEEYQG